LQNEFSSIIWEIYFLTLSEIDFIDYIRIDKKTKRTNIEIFCSAASQRNDQNLNEGKQNSTRKRGDCFYFMKALVGLVAGEDMFFPLFYCNETTK
jgi:hypothetical protein